MLLTGLSYFGVQLSVSWWGLCQFVPLESGVHELNPPDQNPCPGLPSLTPQCAQASSPWPSQGRGSTALQTQTHNGTRTPAQPETPGPGPAQRTQQTDLVYLVFIWVSHSVQAVVQHVVHPWLNEEKLSVRTRRVSSF